MKNNPSKESLLRNHEANDPSLRNVFIIAASVFLMIAACLLSAKLLMVHYSKKHPMQSVAALGILTATSNQSLTRFPAPILEMDDGHGDQIALRTRELAELNGYGWVDRSHGIARIPITRAMELILTQSNPEETNAAPMPRPLKLSTTDEAQP